MSRLHEAAERGDIAEVQDELQGGFLFFRPSVNAKDKEGCSALYVASYNGHPEIVRLLIDRGANVELKVKNGARPLHVAAAGGHTEVVQLLLQNGAESSPSTTDGYTPLHFAATNGQVEVVRLLIKHGANFIAASDDGATPLDLAILGQKNEVVKLMVANCPEALPRLVRGLDDPDVHVAAASATALGGAGDQRATPALVRAFQSANKYETGVLGSLMGTGLSNPVWLRHAILSALGQICDIGVVDFLIDQAASSWADHHGPIYEGRTYDKVVIALVKFGLPVIPKLSSAVLHHKNEEVRAHCVEALGIIGAQSEKGRQAVISILCQTCSDTGHFVKARSFEAIRELADESCVATLIDSLGDKDDHVKSCAAAALVHVGVHAIPRLSEELRKADKQHAVDLHGIIDRIQVIPRIREILLTPSTWASIKPKERYRGSIAPDLDVADYLAEALPGCEAPIRCEYSGVLRNLEQDGYLEILSYDGAIRKITWKGKAAVDTKELKGATFHCKACGHELQVKETLAGKKAKCPKCGQIGQISAETSGWSRLVDASSQQAVGGQRVESETLGAPLADELDLGKGVKLKLKLIPAGSFVMGSPNNEYGRSNDEGPQHKVTISKPFYMGIYEVTQEQWLAVIGTEPWKDSKEGANIGAAVAANYLSWNDATEFCKKLSTKTGETVRLPTEAEWEYACRAGSKTRFYYGDDHDCLRIDDYFWYHRNSGRMIHAVGQKKPNDWGLYDMHGNLWEWSADCYDAKYYTSVNETDPHGPVSGMQRVMRGGSWSNGWEYCRSARRAGNRPDDRSVVIGFRVSVDLK